MAWIFLGEIPSVLTIVGGVLVISGTYLVVKS